ncbi:unnamed protein product [Coccothraustes coccothraustes]
MFSLEKENKKNGTGYDDEHRRNQERSSEGKSYKVTNLRSKVSCSAIVTLGELFAILKKDMDSEADEVAPVLLHMVQNSREFIQKAAFQNLGMMIFDYFVLRINDTHKKVKQKALEVLAEVIRLLEDALNPVMVRLVEGITKNLNSKDHGVHAAAVNALDQSVAHLDLTDYCMSKSVPQTRPSSLLPYKPLIPI